MSTVLQNAQERGDGNPLFNDGDLMYDGVIIRKIQEIPATGAVGTAGARVEPVYLCGAQALGIAWAKRRSEEHTSELQSLMRTSYAVFCLKKKKKKEHIQL